MAVNKQQAVWRHEHANAVAEVRVVARGLRDHRAGESDGKVALYVEQPIEEVIKVVQLKDDFQVIQFLPSLNLLRDLREVMALHEPEPAYREFVLQDAIADHKRFRQAFG